MRVKTVQILWHDKQPIFSVDLSGSLLATAGGDSMVRIWSLDANTVEFRSTLSRHAQAVNCVRWAPQPIHRLASAGDEGVIIVWDRHMGQKTQILDDDGNIDVWKTVIVLRFSTLFNSEDLHRRYTIWLGRLAENTLLVHASTMRCAYIQLLIVKNM